MSVWDYLEGSPAAGGLHEQISAGQVAQAWLLLGSAGAGKRPAALAMACALNCPEQPGVGCGICSTCTRILRRRHPDVHHIVPEGPLIPVDVIREVVMPEAARSPFEGHTKVFIIEEAERMNPSAQNALLKSLEEPQPDTVFILISDREDDLLETIRSRCRFVRLEPVSEKRIVELLMKHGTSEDAAILAARLSEGDFERARAFAFEDEVRERRSGWMLIPNRLSSSIEALECAAEIIDAADSAVAARETQQKQEVAELAETLGEGRGTAQARTALAKRHRRELKRLEEGVVAEALGALASFYRDVVVARRGEADVVNSVDMSEEIEAWAAADVGDADLLLAVERCLDTIAAFSRNANVQLAVEATMIALSRLVSPPKVRAGVTHRAE
jgi:DNA polymerase III subunit delta'